MLLALAAATTALAGVDGRLAASALLVIAFFKARLIFVRFLHLGLAPGWLSAFMLPIGLWLLVIGAGYALVVR